MKKAVLLTLTAVIVILSLASCKEAPTGLWADATYTEDTALGEGGTAFTLTVTAEEKTVTFAISTDKETLGDALTELELIDGKDGDYGIEITEVNGMTLVYEEHGMYWSIIENGEYAMTGADGITLKDGGEYGFTAAK